MNQAAQSIPHPDDNRKRGDVREDGKIFWGKSKSRGKRTYTWLTPEHFERKSEATKKQMSENYRKNAAARIRHNSAYKRAHPDKVAKWSKKWYGENKEKMDDYYYAQWREENRPKARQMVADWAKRNKTRISERAKQRRAANPKLTIVDSVRRLIQRAFQKRHIKKDTRTAEIVGCTWDELASHIESKFAEGMSWDNRSLWHVDHIVPLKSASTKEDIIRLNHWSNLQPLWIFDNLSKGAKMPL